MTEHSSYIPGLPRRMGAALLAVFERDGAGSHREKHDLIWQIQQDRDSLPMTADEDAIFNAADRASRLCYQRVAKYITSDAGMAAIGIICRAWRVPLPTGATNAEIIARAVDRGWWLRQLRKAHARRFEHTSIRLGLTGLKADPYISRESAIRQAKRNQTNQKTLEKTTLRNVETGQEYTVAELAALGMANKALRRGELMTRIRGFEEIASDLKHIGMFWTITCPSKFHSVGGTNRKYSGASPKEAQAYLCEIWKRIRSAFQKAGVMPYGFRIAEPHSDGCPHWHMLFFIDVPHAPVMEEIIKKYALLEDGDEDGAQKNRVKLVNIEAGKGTAAGYIAKYVAKNIDGYGVGDHKTFEDERTYIIAKDLFGQWEITPSQRVTYWSQLWGIRQFQQIGGAPVGVWRELRRIEAETVAQAPAVVKAAWEAVQKREDRQASYADFLRAMGGVAVGREGAVRLAKKVLVVKGRYATYEAEKPCGVYAAGHIRIYESVRYTWEVTRGAHEVAFTWTGVNNCTDINFGELQKRMTASTERAALAVSEKIFNAPALIDWPGIARQGREVERETKDFINRRGRCA